MGLHETGPTTHRDRSVRLAIRFWSEPQVENPRLRTRLISVVVAANSRCTSLQASDYHNTPKLAHDQRTLPCSSSFRALENILLLTSASQLRNKMRFLLRTILALAVAVPMITADEIMEFTARWDLSTTLRHRGLVYDSDPVCVDTCGDVDQTICVDSRDGTPDYVPIVSNQEQLEFGKVTFCQQGCDIIVEVVMADGIEISEYFLHISCLEGDYPTVGNGNNQKPKAGAMNQNDKGVQLSPARVRFTVPLSAVSGEIRDCWRDNGTTETVVKLTSNAPPEGATPPDPIVCASVLPVRFGLPLRLAIGPSTY